MISARSRIQMTAEDFDFVVSCLARTDREAVTLADLLTDEATRDEILDLEVIYHRLISATGCLRVSPSFYFYITVRHCLKRAGFDDRTLADYVATVLTDFAQHEQKRRRAMGDFQPSHPYLSDMLIALRDASPTQRFSIRVDVANTALFLSGIFPERVLARVERRGAPDLSFYEQVGQSNYHEVSRHPLADEVMLKPTFRRLAHEFHPLRCALNRMADHLFHLHGPVDPPPALLGHDSM